MVRLCLDSIILKLFPTSAIPSFYLHALQMLLGNRIICSTPRQSQREREGARPPRAPLLREGGRGHGQPGRAGGSDGSAAPTARCTAPQGAEPGAA